ncbi:unnamed protein product [Spirodela intermedia]|uniref:Xyloglucan endotransglucosylase/hydrolase n=1 Tax=Spirodela intermedia TaxID=51605 RepID=A0A7I8JA24_SPIIN|nr:unnamed protein product [Spirodela intermedia]CAA6666625.1 unnamed protein product [Spirodela intermedia]
MASRQIQLSVVMLVMATRLSALAAPVNFSRNFQADWSPDHISLSENGEPLSLSLDNTSGCGFASKDKYLFGQVGVQIKLIHGDSAGTVTAFYMASEGGNHDELDFEFLGNVTGEPYLVQTNVYVNGSGNREQRHSLWFDPTADFHSYSALEPLPCKEPSGVPFPKNQPMGIYGSVWNADDWATQGGRVKTNWSHAPFVTAFRAFDIDAYSTAGSGGGERRPSWWDSPEMSGLTPHQQRQLKWVRKRHLVYDYCEDAARFGGATPGECSP